MNSNILFRMRDVAICLYHAHKHELVLNKIQLQKMIYLLDCIDSFFYISLTDVGHQTYYHGPYDKNIQNAVDILVFHFLADTGNIRIAENGNVSCEYSLTYDGDRWISFLLKNDSNTQNRSNIVSNLMDSLLSRDLLDSIVQLVYAEPIFVKNQRNGYGVSLDFNNLDENDVFSFMTIILDTFQQEKQDVYLPFVCDLLIEFLSERAKALATTNEEE